MLLINLLRKNILIRFATLLLLTSSCAVNTADSAPEKNRFVHIVGTPAYVLIEPDKSLELINDHVYIYLAKVEGKARNIKTPMKVFGGF